MNTGGEKQIRKRKIIGSPNYDSNENADYEFGEMTLSNYDSKENADYKFGETTLSNYDSNKNADCELGMT